MNQYDRTLLKYIETDFGVVRNCGIAAAKALSDANQGEFQKRLSQFNLILKSHLKKVGVNLYVFLRHELENDPRSAELRAFENRIRNELVEVASFLSSARNASWSKRQSVRAELLNALKLLIKIHEQEKRYLHPVYIELSNKKSAEEPYAAQAVAMGA